MGMTLKAETTMRNRVNICELRMAGKERDWKQLCDLYKLVIFNGFTLVLLQDNNQLLS